MIGPWTAGYPMSRELYDDADKGWLTEYVNKLMTQGLAEPLKLGVDMPNNDSSKRKPYTMEDRVSDLLTGQCEVLVYHGRSYVLISEAVPVIVNELVIK